MSRLGGLLFVIVAVLAIAGVAVQSASSPVPVEKVDPPGPVEAAEVAGSPGAADAVPDEAVEKDGRLVWKDRPTVPYRPLMAEVESVPVPRLAPPASEYTIGGAIPVDFGNPAAKGDETPVTGGSITVRFDSEPKSMNPITETSAVQTYLYSYVTDYLAYQNPETFDYEPAIAKRWIAEDSVKLRADFRGRERRVVLRDGAPSMTVTVTVPKPPAAEGEEPPKLDPIPLTTTDAEGKPVGEAWVGFFPADGKGEVEHRWSDEAGKLDASDLPPGEYVARSGGELYGKLIEAGDGYRLEPQGDPNGETLTLAKEDVVNVERETVFTYYLRDDVAWSDGAPFTAADLEFAYRVINNPVVDGDSIRVYYAEVVDVEALEPHVVRMKYRKQYFLAFGYTAAISIYTPPKHVFEAAYRERGKTLVMEPLSTEEERTSDKVSVRGAEFAKFFNTYEAYNTRPIGMGPYVIESWDRNQKMTFRRRDDYWDPKRAGHLDRIVVRFISDQTTALQALRAGEIDFFYRVTPEQFYEELGGPPEWIERNYVKASWFYPTYSYAGWNMRRPLFADRRVRVALAMLTDKETFLDTKLYGSGVLVSGPQYVFGPGYDPRVRSIDYDPQAALDLLAEAGWIDSDGDGILDKDGRKFSFTMLIPSGNPISEQYAEMAQYNLKRAGIEMNVIQLEWASFLERVMSRDFDVTVMSWAMDPENDPFQLFHGSQADPALRSSNHVGFVNAEADRLIERIRVTLDPEERGRLFNTFHRLIDFEQPYTFLWTRKELGVYHQRYRGVKFYPLRPGFDLREWYVPKELQIGRPAQGERVAAARP